MENIESIPLAELEELRDSLQEDISQIKTQIDYALADKAYDKGGDWIARTKYARRKKGADHQAVVREISRRNKMAKEAEAKQIERLFVEVAKERMPPYLFGEYMNDAIKLQETQK